MKKIVLFSKNLNIGGMENALVNLINELVRFYDITLILEEKTGILMDNIDIHVKIKEYRVSNSKKIIFRKAYNFFKRTIWTLCNKNRYDFSCNYATYSVIGSRLAQVASKNCVYYVHSNYYSVYHGNTKEIKNFFKDHLLENFKNIICVSNESADGLIKVYPELAQKFIVINNIIDHEKILKRVNEFPCRFQKNEKNFLFLGRLENDSKNLHLLLESFKMVCLKHNNYKLYVVGDGSYKDDIKFFIKENSLIHNVILLGELSNPYPYLKNCDCLILTSNYEGFPVIFIEALILNTPIMSTIECSDESIDMRDYIIKLEKNCEDIYRKIVLFEKKSQNIKLDFDKLNKLKLELLRTLIER